MYRFLCLVLLSATAAVGAKRIDINGPLESYLEQINGKLRQIGATTGPFPELPLGSMVKYSDGTVLGLDSLRRTANCWKEDKGNDTIFDISYGYGMLTIVLPHLKIAGRNMSAYARVRDNSVHMSLTIQVADEKCQVKLNEMRVEKMGNVEFGVSRPEYDGANVDVYFKKKVVMKLNDIVRSNIEKIEDTFQGLCDVKEFLSTGDAQKLVDALM